MGWVINGQRPAAHVAFKARLLDSIDLMAGSPMSYLEFETILTNRGDYEQSSQLTW